MQWFKWSSYVDWVSLNYIYMYVIHVHTCNTSSIFISVRRIKKYIKCCEWKVKKRREKSIWIFTPFYQTKRCCYLRFREKEPSGAVRKPYNFYKNSIIHKFSRKIIKLDKGPHFGFKSIFCRIPNQKKKKKIIDLNPYNNKILHCLLRFKVEKITDFDELKIVKKLFRAG